MKARTRCRRRRPVCRPGVHLRTEPWRPLAVPSASWLWSSNTGPFSCQNIGHDITPGRPTAEAVTAVDREVWRCVRGQQFCCHVRLLLPNAYSMVAFGGWAVADRQSYRMANQTAQKARAQE